MKTLLKIIASLIMFIVSTAGMFYLFPETETFVGYYTGFRHWGGFPTEPGLAAVITAIYTVLHCLVIYLVFWWKSESPKK